MEGLSAGEAPTAGAGPSRPQVQPMPKHHSCLQVQPGSGCLQEDRHWWPGLPAFVKAAALWAPRPVEGKGWSGGMAFGVGARWAVVWGQRDIYLRGVRELGPRPWNGCSAVQSGPDTGPLWKSPGALAGRAYLALVPTLSQAFGGVPAEDWAGA